MTDKILQIIKEKYQLEKADTFQMERLKVSGMTFDISAYEALGLGHVSVMKAVGFFGLMKMDTVMITPIDADIPLYSYDRIFAMGNDTLIVELYDTMAENADFSGLEAVKERFAHLTERDPGEHWYDDIKLKESISKKGKKKQSKDFDELTLAHFEEYLKLANGDLTDEQKAIKAQKSKAYVDGLLTNGGPSTDVFKKGLGEEKTALLFKNVLFGTK